MTVTSMSCHSPHPEGTVTPSEGGSKGVKGGTLGRETPDADADDTADVGADEKAKKEPSTDSVSRGHRFSDDPQNLIDLWNEKAPEGHNRVHTVTDGLRVAIRKAYTQVPERQQWEGILQEIEMSVFLCGKKWVTL